MKVEFPIRAGKNGQSRCHASCNSLDCISDVICIVLLDPFINVVGNGSVNEESFNFAESYMRELLERYRGVFFVQLCQLGKWLLR